ncbi:MAG: hypothetical protein CGW95_16335 [Phenylobacterium zucineum]|nr:MAG: hypothetical protein CGW95_16335 [Phenylobacterium zucineum]
MRLHKGDMVRLTDEDGIERVKRVVRLNAAASRIYLAGHNEAGDFQKRHDDIDDPFRWDLASISKLKDRQCKSVHVNEVGRIL